MTENTPTPAEQQTPRWDTPVPHAMRDEVIQAAEEELDLGGDAGSVTLTVVNELHRLGLIRPADDTLDAVTAERDAAYAVMNRAPHSPRCEARRWDVSIESWRPCTCWKSTLSATDLALSGQEGQG